MFQTFKAGLGLAALFLALSISSAHATNIAIFYDSNFVPIGGAPGDEGTNLRASAEAFGHTLTNIDDILPEVFTAGLMDQDVLLIPDFEDGDLPAALSAEARQVIADFVNNGGRLVLVNNDDTGLDFVLLNDIFGFSLSGTHLSGGLISDKTAEADGTIFTHAPDTLPENSATSGIDITTLPAGALTIFLEPTLSRATVALIPSGQGEIVYLGWDWFNSDPPNAGLEDGGWIEVLGQALADADLALSKTVAPASIEIGETATFTLTVSNQGPNDAIGVLLTDTVPAGLTILSITPSVGTCDNLTPFSCDLGDLAVDASATVTVEVQGDVIGNFTNTATVSTLVIDPDAANDVAQAVLTVTNTPPTPVISGAGCQLGHGSQAFSFFPILGILLALAAARHRRHD